MKVELEDLEKGDVVLIGANSSIKAVKLLRDPKLMKTPDWLGRPRYGRILCSQKMDKTILPYTRNYKGYNGQPQSYSGNRTEITFGLTDEDHNSEIYIDFNYKNIYLVKKGEQL